MPGCSVVALYIPQGQLKTASTHGLFSSANACPDVWRSPVRCMEKVSIPQVRRPFELSVVTAGVSTEREQGAPFPAIPIHLIEILIFTQHILVSSVNLQRCASPAAVTLKERPCRPFLAKVMEACSKQFHHSTLVLRKACSTMLCYCGAKT